MDTVVSWRMIQKRVETIAINQLKAAQIFISEAIFSQISCA